MHSLNLILYTGRISQAQQVIQRTAIIQLILTRLVKFCSSLDCRLPKKSSLEPVLQSDCKNPVLDGVQSESLDCNPPQKRQSRARAAAWAEKSCSRLLSTVGIQTRG